MPKKKITRHPFPEGEAGNKKTVAGLSSLVTRIHISSLPLCRESVAIFLTRGDLWQNWVDGKKLFEELLLDFEPCVSSGCWMRSSCSDFITGPVEHYCPITFGKKIDPSGKFIRHYLPELQQFPGTCACYAVAVQFILYHVH